MSQAARLPVIDPAEPSTAPVPAGFKDVKGWFWNVDQLLFDWFLSHQNSGDGEQLGDLLELGAYMGKSAIFMGGYLRDGEEFTVCDLFGSPAEDASNSAETQSSYATLTRQAFETNYLAFHPSLPTVIQAPTSVVGDQVREASCRFIHVDASHLYEHVRGDIEASRTLSVPGAVVVFDDYRSEHCPGVAAAVWGAVATSGLQVVCVSGTKLYATWGDPEPLREALRVWLEGRADLWHGTDEIAGQPVVRIGGEKALAPAPPRPLRAPKVPVLTAVPSQAQRSGPGPRSKSVRRLAKDLLPPIVTRAIIAKRRG
ncbi:class I SAM-dependent methyltransferase [Streptomyces sp. G-G2]|uniref:class I SAM-dependent methyltransferase n=1 Tax=Streptomyces sp. G-G2 TaxID=3046201 RepID=UPI0024BB3D96|nr:class I SAM-dependent methyltransferase [Streptomyces sp. G-G2]MDJ0383091.1 class I SAM-dependent methyltransferase [Streptomyces sp. G-G2]